MEGQKDPIEFWHWKIVLEELAWFRLRMAYMSSYGVRILRFLIRTKLRVMDQ